MRLLLAILAMIGLLASPLAATAAQAGCDRAPASAAMARRDMAMTSAMPGMSQMAEKGDRCCDPAKNKGAAKHGDVSCAQTCAAMCGVIAVLPTSPVAPLTPAAHSLAVPTLMASLKPGDPGRLDRPPRSIA